MYSNALDFGAVSILVTACYVNFSLIGFAYFISTALWCCHVLPRDGRRRVQQSHSRFWASVAGISMLAVILAGAVNFGAAISIPGLRQPTVEKLLRLLGFAKSSTFEGFLEVVLPFIAAFCVSTWQAHRYRQISATTTDNQRLSGPFSPYFSAAGTVAAISVFTAAFVLPTPLAAPYVAVAVLALSRCNHNKTCNAISSSLSTTAQSVVQIYVGCHLGALYLWWWALGDILELQNIGNALGLFRIASSVDQPLLFCVQVANVAALLLLLIALGTTRQQSGVDIIEEDDVQGSSLHQPLIFRSDVSPPGRSATHSHHLSRILHWCAVGNTWLRKSIIVGAELFVAGLDALFSQPLFVSLVLSGVSLLHPSIIGAVLFMFGLLSLPHPRLISITNSMLSIFVLMWLLATYVASILGDKTELMDGIGLHVYGCDALLGFTALYLAAAACAIHAYHTHVQQEHEVEVCYSETARQIIVAFQGGSTMPPISADNAASTSNAMHSHDDQTVSEWQPILQAVWYICAVSCPLLLFYIGQQQYDVLHLLYLLGLVALLASKTVLLAPKLAAEANSSSNSWLIRVYTSIHACALYIVYVGGYPTFSSILQPANAERILRIIGLWQPNAIELVPILGLLVLVTIQEAIARKLAHYSNTAEDQYEVSSSATTWKTSPAVWVCETFVIKLGPVLLVLIGYVLVLYDTDKSILSMLYLVSIISMLAWPPQKGTWTIQGSTTDEMQRLLEQHTDGGELLVQFLQSGWRVYKPGGNRNSHKAINAVMICDGRNESPSGWFPLACFALLASIDFAFQLILPTVAQFDIVSIPPEVLQFFKDYIGWDASVQGVEFTKQLARPLAILLGVYVYRWMFCRGTIRRQLHKQGMTVAEQEDYAMEKQLRWMAFLKRLSILHASKLVCLMAFAASIQVPGSIGWFLVVGVVISSYIVGPMGSTDTVRSVSLLGGYFCGALWFLAQYAVYMPWVKDIIAAHVNLLQWMGLHIPASDGEDVSLQAVLVLKLLFMISLATKYRSLHWYKQLPETIRKGGKCGAICALFWPEPYTAFAASLDAATSREIQSDDTQPTPILGTVQSVIQKAAERAQKATRQALQAVDWVPLQNGGSHAGTSTVANDHEEEDDEYNVPEREEDILDDACIEDIMIEEEEEAEARQQHTLNQHAAIESMKWQSFKAASQDWIERWWQDGSGIDMCMFSILVSAFSAANFLSLVLMFLLAVSMLLCSADAKNVQYQRARISLWKWAVVPVLGACLVWQFGALVGLPPLDAFLTSALQMDDDVKDWLGLGAVHKGTLWVLFLSFSINVLQMHHDTWRNNEHSSSSEPLLSDTFYQQYRQQSLYKPLTIQLQPEWQWHDWVRYYWYRRYLDVVLVLVVALCTLENDIIHAGYLALALLFFRARIQLRSERNALFFWLPLYNFIVMAALLLYQAPFELVWDIPIDDDFSKSCTLAHLLGLYKLRPVSSQDADKTRSSFLSWGYEGALADIFLFALLRIQTHIFCSATYSSVMEVVAAEEDAERVERKKEAAKFKASQAESALEESRQRLARSRRVARLKESLHRGFSQPSSGSMITPTIVDFSFLDAGSNTSSAFNPPPTIPPLSLPPSTLRVPPNQAPELFANAFIPGSSLRSRRPSNLRPGGSGTDSTYHTPAATGVGPDLDTPFGSARSHLPEAESDHALATYDRDALDFTRPLTPTSTSQQSPRFSTSVGAAVGEGSPGLKALLDPEPTTPRGSFSGGAGVSGGTHIPATAERHHELYHEPPSSKHWGGSIWKFIARRVRRIDRESYIAYCLFIIAFIADFSILTVVYPLSMFLYSMISVKPSKEFWQAALVYSEAVIIVQYAWQVPTRLGCGFVTVELQQQAEIIGIHSSAARCIPLFLVYLATLTHTYGLATRHAPQRPISSAASGPEAEAVDVEAGSVPEIQEQQGEAEDHTRRVQRMIDAADFSTAAVNFGGSVNEVVVTALSRLSNSVLSGLVAFYEFVIKACTAAERPPHFIIVTMKTSGTSGEKDELHNSNATSRSTSRQSSTYDEEHGQLLTTELQDILNTVRAKDIMASQQQLESTGAAALGLEASSSRSNRHNEQQQAVPQIAETFNTSSPASIDLATMGPLRLRFDRFLPTSSSTIPTPRTARGTDSTPLHTPRVLQPVSSARQSTKEESKAEVATLLLEVIPDRSTLENSPGVCSFPGWPARSFCPAATAAAVLRSHSDVVLGAEHFSRNAHDFYASSAFLDIAAFVYVAVYYNQVVHGASGSLSEITNEHVVPLGYLLTLIVLFMFIVLDRVAYTLGSPLCKAVLHAVEIVIYFWYCMDLFWNPLASVAAKNHLRLLLLLKCASFCFSALQLRTSYPPPASYSNGMGRHTFYFMRHVNTLNAVGFHIFVAIPFLYELRQLLDWSCTPTTLMLYDWLKLEDINMSLYFVTYNYMIKSKRRPGTRQPRYLKFFQGTLLFVGLLLLLWVPLLVFSTGNPTYQVPTVVNFGLNVSLHTAKAPQQQSVASTRTGVVDESLEQATFPLLSAGDRRAVVPWVGNGTLPSTLDTDYSANQLQLLCAAADADTYWKLTPPARIDLVNKLNDPSMDVAVSFGFTVARDLPLPSQYSNPRCTGTSVFTLAQYSREALHAVLNGEAATAPLLRPNTSTTAANHGGGSDDTTTPALFPLFWLLKGDMCVMQAMKTGDISRKGVGPARRRKTEDDWSWANLWLACNVSLESTVSQSAVNDHDSWWRMGCQVVDDSGNPVSSTGDIDDEEERGTCPSHLAGARFVVLLDKVQGGLIGITLSRFGIIGLYTVFVYGIGRFLRLSFSNLRLRVPFEDLPNTRRLVSLCQDIYIARAEGELLLEEELYNALISAYRLPSVMFELTKKKR